MNLLSIDGWVVDPLPSEYGGEWQPLVDAGRNANGDVIGDLINTKRKLELKWAVLTPAQLATLRSYTDNFFVSVTWIDTATNALATITCYTSPVTWSTFKYNSSTGLIEYYTDIRVALVEK